MKVFTASLATETNSFSPIYTGLEDFYDAFYAPPGEHPSTPTLCSAPLIACREIAEREGWQLVEGTCTWAEPGGMVSRHAYEKLRDEILSQVAAACPLDSVVLGLHGAMMAHGYADCEGDLLSKVRALVGDKTIIAASFDPHSHLSQQRIDACDILIAFREFPHTDFMQRARELVALTARCLRGEIRPQISVFDCRMIDVMPTSAEPMRSFVDDITALEQNDSAVLSVSVIHGFLAGDSADLGAKMVVVTDNAKAYGDTLACEIGMKLYGLRGQTRMQLLPAAEAIALAKNNNNGKPVVIADVWDNPGGGVAGDSTILLAEMMRCGVSNAAVSTIWDPQAVRHCFVAGERARIALRFGAKSGPESGAPIDAKVEVIKLNSDATQPFGGGIVRMGKCVTVRLEGGIDIILNSVRAQTFSPALLECMNIMPQQKSLLVVKSTNHFYDGFCSIAGKIIYADGGAPYPADPRTTAYKNLRRPLWPIVENPHSEPID